MRSTEPCTTFNGMRNTTRKPQNTSTKLTKRELDARLKAARARLRDMKAEGKPLPNPTKDWSNPSIESLTIALSGK